MKNVLFLILLAAPNITNACVWTWDIKDTFLEVFFVIMFLAIPLIPFLWFIYFSFKRINWTKSWLKNALLLLSILISILVVFILINSIINWIFQPTLCV